MPSRLVASTTTPGHDRSMRPPAGPPVRERARSCPAPAEAASGASISTSVSSSVCPLRLVRWNTAAIASTTPVGITHRRQLDQPRPVPVAGAVGRRRPECQAGLADSADAGDGHHSRRLQSARATRDTSFFRPMNELTCAGRFPGNESRVRSGGNSSRSPSQTSWKIRVGRPRSRRRCSPRSTTPSRRASDHASASRWRPKRRSARRGPPSSSREHRLIGQAGIAGVVDDDRLIGVQPDSGPQWRARYPISLPRALLESPCRRSDGIPGRRERGGHAVAHP